MSGYRGGRGGGSVCAKTSVYGICPLKVAQPANGARALPVLQH